MNAQKEDAGRTEHTPLPWEAKALNFGEFELHSGKHEFALIYASDGMDEATPFPAEANAAFIVRAVNSHADLVAALQSVTDELERISIDEDQVGDVLANAASIIAKATGTSP